MENEAEDDLLWPRLRPSRIDHQVLGPIFGAYHAARHRLDSAAREHGLDATEVMVLHAVRLDAGCPPWSIRRRLGFTRSTLGSILDRLERDGRITRTPGAYSRQRFELRLTRSGVIAADLARYVIESLEEEIAGYTSPQERRGAVAVFGACMALDRPDRPHP
jgi:DNA-binding MarR family transcriptional regulator